MKNKIIFGLSLLCTILIIWLAIEIKNPTIVEKTTVDTTRSVKVDSFFIRDTLTISPDIPPPDTVYKDSTTNLSNPFSYYRNYTTIVSDSLLHGTIKTTVQGYLISQRFVYTPNYPIRINTTVDQYITKQTIRTVKPKSYISVGLDVGGNKDGFTTLEPSLWYNTSNKNSIGVGYDLQQKSYTIGLRYNLRNIFK